MGDNRISTQEWIALVATEADRIGADDTHPAIDYGDVLTAAIARVGPPPLQIAEAVIAEAVRVATVIAEAVRVATSRRIKERIDKNSGEWPTIECDAPGCDGGTVDEDEDCDECGGEGYRDLTGPEVGDVDLTEIVAGLWGRKG